ncbi:hypothetical protein VFPPC_18224 [Pochonia chlamydosporia 170]|uniref:Uncharacterized protein n=1 Tax=Pochonia chlamydosporia 170 TaxID=1380566 RepID=A0A219APY3_METCM|nr:hypothetical protein VFPPC_18224 [Pochonia chlamydosporia 170]OWT42612.1 hypothetical protein VFPPC_18224 [Pochonia chlamydosporia 170]
MVKLDEADLRPRLHAKIDKVCVVAELTGTYHAKPCHPYIMRRTGVMMYSANEVIAEKSSFKYKRIRHGRSRECHVMAPKVSFLCQLAFGSVEKGLEEVLSLRNTAVRGANCFGFALRQPRIGFSSGGEDGRAIGMCSNVKALVP